MSHLDYLLERGLCKAAPYKGRIMQCHSLSTRVVGCLESIIQCMCGTLVHGVSCDVGDCQEKELCIAYPLS